MERVQNKSLADRLQSPEDVLNDFSVTAAGGCCLFQQVGLYPGDFLPRLSARRGTPRRALEKLIQSLQARRDRTSYSTYRAARWQIRTGMMESTAKQFVETHLNGPGIRWYPE